MDYTKLGRSGLEVSRICMGCMSLGAPNNQSQPWALGYQESKPLIKKALELGINFFDTANVYSGGASEEVAGRALKELANRDEIVLATKVFAPMRSGPNSLGLSRKTILAEIDNSLRRLGTDYVDLYQIHRWDPTTSIEETLEALHDVVKAGKARYLGASTMYAWQLAKALAVAERHGWTGFISMQNQLNLIYREEEREMLPLCTAEGIGVIPWGPLARGRLARDWGVETRRSEKDPRGAQLYSSMTQADREVIDQVGEIATRRGVPRVQIALAWLFQKREVTAPIVGVSESRHLDESVAALGLKLSTEEVAALEQPYVPRPWVS
jgi:1-deoxyxylulose-5-phosphate synthase